MANRHANKRLRRAILARMAKTGEGYQTARAQVLRQGTTYKLPRAPVVDLVEVNVAGRPVVLTLIERPKGDGVLVLQSEIGRVPNFRQWRRPWSA